MAHGIGAADNFFKAELAIVPAKRIDAPTDIGTDRIELAGILSGNVVRDSPFLKAIFRFGS